MTKLKVGAVGAGHATRTLTLPAFQVLSKDLAKLQAVCDPDEKIGQDLAQKNGLNYYSSLEEMVAKEKLDVVIVNAPVKLHAGLAIQGLDLGCHVLIEKPAVAEIKELEGIKSSAVRAGKVFSVVHNYKYYEGPQKAKKLYEEGVLGEILHIDRIWLSPPQNDRMESDVEGWWHKAKGGRLADGLPHMLYLPYMFVGKMDLLSVSARKLAKDRPWSFCDEANITLDTPKAYVNIRLSTNQTSWPYKGYIYHTMIYGEKLTVLCSHHEANILWNGKSRLAKTGAAALLDLLGEKLKPKKPLSRGGHSGFYEAFFKYLNGSGPNPAPYEEIYNVASLTDQIGTAMDRSIREGIKILTF